MTPAAQHQSCRPCTVICDRWHGLSRGAAARLDVHRSVWEERRGLQRQEPDECGFFGEPKARDSDLNVFSFVVKLYLDFIALQWTEEMP